MTSLAAAEMIRMIRRHRRVLLSTTRFELLKRYSGSLLGPVWIVLYPVLFLSVYLFLYLVVFKVRFPELSELGYVTFVFAGLLPYIGLMESAASTTVCIKQNIHLIKNVILPIDLIPIRAVTVALASELVGLVLLLALLALDGNLGWSALWLPVILIFQALFLIGLGWMLAAAGVLLPDTSQVVGLLLLFLMFVSPIAFKPEMVPASLQAVLIANPIAYMIDAFRTVLMANQPVRPAALAVFFAISLALFGLGAGFFRRFKGSIVDYE